MIWVKSQLHGMAGEAGLLTQAAAQVIDGQHWPEHWAPIQRCRMKLVVTLADNAAFLASAVYAAARNAVCRNFSRACSVLSIHMQVCGSFMLASSTNLEVCVPRIRVSQVGFATFLVSPLPVTVSFISFQLAGTIGLPASLRAMMTPNSLPAVLM